MEQQPKKSFVLYFDMLDSVRRLSCDQAGYLFLALFEYARAAAEEDWDREAVLARFPDMEPAARMAFSFMAEAIRRDTEKWLAKHERYRQAAITRAMERRVRAISGEDTGW